MRAAAFALALVSCSGQGWARDAHCMARILADVPAEEAPEQIKSKSSGQFGPVSQIKVNKQTGKMLFCAQGSYCYNSNAFEMTTACRIKRDLESSDSQFYSYFTR